MYRDGGLWVLVGVGAYFLDCEIVSLVSVACSLRARLAMLALMGLAWCKVAVVVP